MAIHARARVILLLAVVFTVDDFTGALAGAVGSRRHMLQASPSPAIDIATAMPTPSAPPSSPSLITAEVGPPTASQCNDTTRGLSNSITMLLLKTNGVVVFNNVTVDNRCTGVKVLIYDSVKSVPPGTSLVGVSGSSPGLVLTSNEGDSTCSGFWQQSGVLPFPPLFTCVIQDCDIAKYRCFARMNCACTG